MKTRRTAGPDYQHQSLPDHDDFTDPDWSPAVDTEEEQDDDYEHNEHDESDASTAKDKDNDIDNESVTYMYDDDELEYFNTMTRSEQHEILEMEAQIENTNFNAVPLRFRILKAPLPTTTKALIMDKLNSLKVMDPSSSEHQKLGAWIQGITRLPLGVYKELPISVKTPDGVKTFLRNMRDTMDREVFGHQKIKNQIVMTFAKWVSNPHALGMVLGIQGPAGVGKTTLIKDGICRALGLPYAFIPLGGANDSSFLDGHSYTYEGSVWGKIADALMQCQCSNPVLVFDELDKVQGNMRGEEIFNILIHLTDATQNDCFCDKYFSNIKIDLSRAIFVFTYNDESRIHPILKDRMTRMSTENYKMAEKTTILCDYIIPKLLRQYNLCDHVTFPKDVVEALVRRDGVAPGMRDMQRIIENVLGNLNVHHLTGDASVLNDKREITFPCTVTNEMVVAFSSSLSSHHRTHLPDPIAHIYM